MLKKTNRTIAIVFFAAVLVACASLKMYYIREDSGGELLWNSNEAYLFINVVTRGYRVSYLKYPWEVFKEYLHVPAFPDDIRVSVTVIRVTPAAVERHVVDLGEDTANAPIFYTSFGKSIYAHCPGVVCKWTGDRFEPATAEEEQSLEGGNRLSKGDFSDVDGWSKRAIGGGPDYKFAIDVGGQFTLSERNEDEGNSGYRAVSIYVQRPRQAPERIWYLDGHPRRMSKTDYERAFGR